MKNKVLIVLVSLMAFGMSSCRVFKSHKDTTVKSLAKSDSLIHLEITRIDTVKIEKEELKRAISFNEFKKGKPFKFRSKKGRVHTKLELVNDTIHITSRCDSLERYVLSTEVYIEKTRNQISSFKQIIEDQKTIIRYSFWYKIGFFGMLVLNLILLTKGVWSKFIITKI